MKKILRVIAKGLFLLGIALMVVAWLCDEETVGEAFEGLDEEGDGEL